jgi:hypothetical protein
MIFMNVSTKEEFFVTSTCFPMGLNRAIAESRTLHGLLLLRLLSVNCANFDLILLWIQTKNTIRSLPNIQGVSAKTFEPSSSVIFQRIFVKFKMQIF